MIRTIFIGTTIFAALSATPALAQDEDSDAGGGVMVGVSGGTLGVGPEVTVRISETFGIRGNASLVKVSYDTESDGVEYQGDLELESFGAMVDFYPFGGGFRVSGGARLNNNAVALFATPTEATEIGDEVFTPEEIGTLTGRVEAESEIAPTATIGWGGGLTRGLKFGIDLGVMFQGTPRVTELSADGTAANTAEFQAALEEERTEIEEDIEQFDLYPILQFSLGYRF